VLPSVRHCSSCSGHIHLPDVYMQEEKAAEIARLAAMVATRAPTGGSFSVPAVVAPTPQATLPVTRHARRVYVGGLPVSADADTCAAGHQRQETCLQ
jgi:hypothetical protein